MALQFGSRLGPYEIMSKLGEGGMGEVYRARDPRLGRDVAIKVLAGDVAADPLRVSRFAQEARAVAALSHPNVLAIFDVSGGNPPFLVTELLEGETLRARIARTRMSPSDAVDVILAIAAGLGAAHARGIIHRDLKPDNVFLTRDALVKILDFGLAKEMALAGAPMDIDVTRSPTTLDGIVVGTVGYMAPEQLRGQTVDPRTDIFAVGAMLYEMVTGERAFKGDSLADTMSAVLREAPPDLSIRSGMPPSLARVVTRCLDKDPDRRFQSARDLMFALEPLSSKYATSAPPRQQAKSIAVLPFANMSGDPENEFFSDGLAEELINALARLDGLRVAARTSAFQFRGRNADVREIGRQLGVDHVLEGSVRRAGNRLRITAQLINVHDGYHVWSERYDRQMADVFDIQDEITAAIVKTIAPTLVGDEESAARRHTHNVQAYELYLRGRHFWYMRTPQSIQMAIGCYERAIVLDADYALAHAGLADSYTTMTLYGFMPLSQSRPKAEAAARRAMALGPDLAEVHFAVAVNQLWASDEWPNAWREMGKALAIQPEAGVVQAYYAACLVAAGRYDDARAAALKASADDALSPFAHAVAAAVFYLSGRFEDAVRAGDRALALHPEFALALYLTGFALCQLGQFDRAIERHERLVALSHRNPIYIGLLGHALGLAGRHSEALALVDELTARRGSEYVVPTAWLLLWAGLGDRDRAYDTLVDCVREGVNGMAILLFLYPHLKSLAEEPRFAEVFSRVNLTVS